jgi:transcriptional regulator with XRE-family HTH domain
MREPARSVESEPSRAANPQPAQPAKPQPAQPARRQPILRSAVYAGDRQLRRACRRFGEEFRELRLRAGFSQAAVARAIGVARSAICDLEAGDEGASLRLRARAAAVLGAETGLALYPSNSPLISDATQARLLESLIKVVHPTWRTTVEAPVPGPGRRSIDLRLDGPGDVVLMEVESRVRTLEAAVRELHDERAAVALAEPGRPIHVVLALPPTRHHRALVRSHPALINVTFPIPSRLLEAAVRDGGRWPGDGILWLAKNRG